VFLVTKTWFYPNILNMGIWMCPFDLKLEVNLFDFVLGKMKVLKCPVSRKWDFSQFGYKVWWIGRLKVSLDLKHHVNLFGFIFGKIKVLEWLTQKWDFSLYGYMFDKYEGWACPSMSLDAKRDIWMYLVLNSVNIKYWDDPCRKKEILAYMVTKFDK